MNREQFAGEIAHGAFGRFFGFRPTHAPKRVQRRTHFAGADIFADEMRFADRNIKLWRRVFRTAWRELDDEAFLAAFKRETGFLQRFGAAAGRERR